MFLSKLALKRPVFITMLTIALVLFGLGSMQTLGVDLIPPIEAPFVTITTIYPGADAKTIEEDVVKKIEDSVGTLNGIKHINSTAVNNVGLVVVQFVDGTNHSEATQEVRDKIALIKEDLPTDAEDPLIEKLDINAESIMTIVMQAPAGEKMDVVTDFAEDNIKDRLQTIQGVGSVEMYGGREKEIRVLLDHMKTNQLGLSALNVVQLLKSSSIEVPAGTVFANKGHEELNVKGDGEIQSIKQLRQMPLFQMHGNTIRVKDIARVEDGLEEEESSSMMDLSPAIALKVKKQGSVNVVQLAEEVKAEIEKIKSELPDGYSLSLIGDSTVFTKAAVSSATSDIFLGALFAIAIIFLFLMNKRATAIIAVSLPTSIIGTFLFVYAMGFTLNIMTTLALSISVGILTDDAIVIIEAIFRHISKGKDKIRAILDAANEVGLAVVSSELALICVFGPTVMLEGLIGSVFREFGLTVVAAILISMTVSFTVAPLMASVILKEEKKDFFLFKIMDRFLIWLENGYANTVAMVLKHRLVTLIIFMALFVFGISLAGKLPSTFFPDVDRGEFDLTVELNSESSIDKSKMVAREIVETLSQFGWEKEAFLTIGGGARREKNVVKVRVMMNDKENRTIAQAKAMEEVREKIKYMEQKYDATVKTSLVKSESMESYPIMFSLVGNNLETILYEASKMMRWMKNDGGFVSISTTDKGNKKEIKIKFDHEKMSALGVNVAQSAVVLRNLIAGEKIADMDDAIGEQIEVKMYLEDAYQNIDGIRSIPFPAANNRLVKLSDIADVTYGSSKVQITRLDRSRQIQITASMAIGYDAGTQGQKIYKYAEENLPPGVSLVMQGDVEQMEDSFGSLALVLVIAIFLIYIVLASQFNSFIHPFTIMSALPFALTGAIFALYGMNQIMSVMSFIGIIMLMGIVTKNSILLVDYTLQRIDEGVETIEALIEAARTRLRPILMTAGGTMFGMMPVVISQAEGAEMKHSMGWAVMGGLAFSTLITLFVVPIIFSLVERFRRKKSVEEIKRFNEMINENA